MSDKAANFYNSTLINFDEKKFFHITKETLWEKYTYKSNQSFPGGYSCQTQI